MARFRFSLTFLVLSSLSSLLVLTWLLLSIISFTTAEKDLVRQKGEEARLLLASFTALLPPDLAAVSSSAAATLAQRLAREPAFVALTVIGADGTAVYSLGEAAPDPQLPATVAQGTESVAIPEQGGRIVRYAPIRAGETVVGAARLALSLSAEQQLLARSRHLFLAYFALDFLLLLAFGSLLLSRFIVSPVKRLLAATERISSGDYGHRLQLHGGREIAELADAFNSMAAALKSQRDEVGRHVASLEQANRQLQEARQESLRSERMASVGLLAAGTAHEIGTPLAAIMGYASLLREEPTVDPERDDCLRRIEQEAGRIDRIVRDLLDYARPSPALREEVSVGPLVTSTVEMLQRQGALKLQRVVLDIADPSPVLLADPHQLQQVIINLLINARDAMAEGGTLAIGVAADLFQSPPAPRPVLPLAVAGRRREDFGGVFQAPFRREGEAIPCVRLEVADTGSGISAEHLERIFDPFFTTKEPGKGTGLGLAITARIVDSLGGRITVESGVGQGTRFAVWLPIAQGEA